MGEENRSLLEEEIKAEIKRLGSLESGSQEHTTAVDSLTKLYKLKLEEDKNTYERLDKIENREIDQESKTAQMAESVKDRYFRFGSGRCLAPLVQTCRRAMTSVPLHFYFHCQTVPLALRRETTSPLQL